MIQLSVIICTHNPNREALDRVIASLKRQTLGRDEWELLIVDNASRESVSGWLDLGWHAGGRHLAEATLGLAAARRCGIAAATGEVLVFVDDDNVLAYDYLEVARRIGVEWPMLGVWGCGKIIPEFEVMPDPELAPFLAYLAIRNYERAIWGNVLGVADAIPWGCGLCIRRSVADAFVTRSLSGIEITGRKGNSLDAGEDLEISYTTYQMGQGSGVFPELALTHIIPRQRTTRSYLLRLVESSKASHYLLHYKWFGKVPRTTLARFGLYRLRGLLTMRSEARSIYGCDVRGAVRALAAIRASVSNR